MADIQSAAQWLGRLVAEEAQYLYKVEDQVKELRDELDWMQCFLREADASRYDNALARRWIAQIREFAYDAEDMTEKFLNRVITNSSGRADILSMLKKYTRVLWEFRLVHEIGADIETLKHKMSVLSTKLNTYHINLSLGESSSSWQLRLRNQTYNHDEEKDITGRVEEKNGLVTQLESGVEGKRVISITGEAGVGKTFLAKRLFHDTKIRKNFDAFAWAYVSQPCQCSAIQQDLLSSLTSKSKEQIAQMVDKELKDELRKVQCKYKCFIVLDGIWDTNVWESLKNAFPITSSHYRSKLLITNQLHEVAIHVHPDAYILKLERFNYDDSRLLLERKVNFVPTADTDYNKSELKEESEVLFKNMLQHCEGLPLAISVLGGVLSTKKTLKEWKEVDKYIRSYVTDANHPIQKWKRILECSYYELPFQLKPSFLYLGYFPANLEIPTTKIFRLWEAEGLVSSGDDELSEDTLEDVAERCLGELIERSFLQVGSRGLDGIAKTCLVHNLMQKLCMDKASQGNWLNVVQFGAKEEDQADQPFRKSTKVPKSSKSAKKKFRRLAIYYSKESGKLPSDYKRAKYIRSLLFFNTLETDEVLIPLKRKVLKKAFEHYKLLRVLDIENIELQKLPREIGFLIHLRYLSLRGSCVSKLPKSIKNLRCLQTLDLRVLSFVNLRIPDVLWMMERLVHLFLPSNSFSDHNKVKLQLKKLVFLETLSNFSNICIAKDVGTLSSLRRFSSCDFLDNSESIEPLLGCPSSKLQHLDHLSLRLQGQILKANSKALGSCNNLHKLWVKGEIAKSLDSGMIAQSLVRLSFHNSKFENDPMEVLEKLSHLRSLSLKQASYMGTKMTCSKGGFPKLSHLTLKGLQYLEDWELIEGALSKLSHLKISDCQQLKMIPEGMESVKTLRELEISFMPSSFFEELSPNEIKRWVHYSKVEGACIRITHVLNLEKGASH